MSDQAQEREPCEHVYASEHEPGHDLYWVRRCMLCNRVNWDDLDAQLQAAKREARAQAIEDCAKRLRELHQPFGIYDECGHDHTEDDAIAETAIDCGDFLSCADGKVYDICRSCCIGEDQFEGQREDCADGHGHGPGEPICATSALVADLLRGLSTPSEATDD